MQWSKPLLRILASPIRTSCSPCCYIWPLVQLPANRPREEAEDGPSIGKAHQYLDRVRANGLVNPLLPVTLWSKYKNLNAHTQGRWHSIVVSSPGTWNEVTKPLQYRTRSTQRCNSCPLSFLSATWLPVLAGKAFGTSSIQAGVMALSIQSSPQGTLHTSGGPSRNQLSSLWTSPGPPAGRWQTGGSVVAGRAYLKEETTLHRGNCLVNQSKWKSARTCVCGKPLNIGDNSQKK